MDLGKKKVGAYIANIILIVNAAIHFSRTHSMLQFLPIFFNMQTILGPSNIILKFPYAPISSLRVFLLFFRL